MNRPGPSWPCSGGRFKGHQLLVLGCGLEVVQRRRRPDGVAVGRMVDNVADQLAVQVDAAAVPEAVQVVLSGFGHGSLS